MYINGISSFGSGMDSAQIANQTPPSASDIQAFTQLLNGSGAANSKSMSGCGGASGGGNTSSGMGSDQVMDAVMQLLQQLMELLQGGQASQADTGQSDQGSQVNQCSQSAKSCS